MGSLAILSKFQLHRLQHLHNWGVCITASLRKYDHVSYHRCQLNWLSLPSLIKYRSLCVMHKIYYGPLNPPIIFGSSHTYSILDGLIDLSSQCIVDCLQHKNSFAMWPLIGGMICLPDVIVASTTFPSAVYDHLLTIDIENDYYDLAF